MPRRLEKITAMTSTPSMGTAEANGHAAAHAGDQPAEDGTQQQVISGKRRCSGGGEEGVDGERGQGIDQHRPQRVDREGQSLFFHAKKEQGVLSSTRNMGRV